MRSLAQDLGVEAMSLYRHVHGKEDLLEGVVALLICSQFVASRALKSAFIIGRPRR